MVNSVWPMIAPQHSATATRRNRGEWVASEVMTDV
jgi:hypothetical protein